MTTKIADGAQALTARRRVAMDHHHPRYKWVVTAVQGG